jgi:hypothetical protein
MDIFYDKLKKVASQVRAELAEKGEIDIGRRRIRKKPRDKIKSQILYEMALERINRYKPYKKGKKIVLPYFR